MELQRYLSEEVEEGDPTDHAHQAQIRAHLIDKFVRQLVKSKFAGQVDVLDGVLAANKYYFLDWLEVRFMLKLMGEVELSADEHCVEAFKQLDDGVYELKDDNYIEISQIARDLLQIRRHMSRFTVGRGRIATASRGLSAEETSRTMWVGRIPPQVDSEILKGVCEVFGQVESVTLREKAWTGTDGSSPRSGTSRTWAFVRFVASGSVASALNAAAQGNLAGECAHHICR